ncbi:hypothetical protein S245_022954, partial [Arachis hypogaea]
FIPNLNNLIKPLHDRLKKNPPPWTDKHSDIIRFLKTKVRNLPCLYLPIPHAFKIVETDASDLGYGVSLISTLSISRVTQTLSLTFSHVNICREIIKGKMPKKATLASVRGRGIRLALPGPSKKSGSSTPTGSSTQQPSPITQEPTGSSTQITKNVVESSTQPPSSQTAKQTKADYAFPIQTLLALQDAGLTKLHKKSWADICDSSDEDEIDLTKLISQMATQKIICNDPKGKTIAQTMPPQSNQTQPANTQFKQPSTYISKNKFSSVLLMEPEFWEKSPFKVIPKVFPPGFHFRPTALNKTRQFYEFILVDSDSVSIKHYKDPKDATNITHSTIQILKVLTPNQFGKNPNNTKKFSNPYDPIGYSYWDYMDAWTR